ncbi:MAG: hypothetical protein ACOY3X_05115 [Pseudomonadota bacterium]
MTSLQMVLATAVITAIVTTVLLCAVFRWWMLPRLEARLAAQIEASRDDFARALERSVRKGLADGVAMLPSREVLQDTTRTLARTGMELVGDSLGAWLGGRRGRRSTDRTPGGDGSGNDSG